MSQQSWINGRNALVVACAISAGIHAGLAPAHLRQEPAVGAGFLASVLVLGALCITLTALPRSLAPVAAASLVLAGLLVAYALATTTGIPVLHPEAEPVDGLALATKAIELAGLVMALGLVVQARPAGLLVPPRPKGTTR
jgi:hypothetical protein